MCPEPMSNGVASTPLRWMRRLVLSVCPAVVISADLTSAGVHAGWACRSSAATPATCGLDMDVPDSPSNRLPWWPEGDTAATMSTPGAVRSGLIKLPSPTIAGPTLENAATSGARGVAVDTADIDAVGAAVEARYALIAAPSVCPTWTVGITW